MEPRRPDQKKERKEKSIIVSTRSHLDMILFCYVGTPDHGYCFKSNFLLLKLEWMEDKQEVKDHILATLLSMVPTQK